MINHKGIRKSSIFFKIHQDIVGDLHPSTQFYSSGCHIVGRANRAPTLGCSIEILHDIYIGECGSTLYVGLTGIVPQPNTKVYGDRSDILRFFSPSGCAIMETI